MHTSSALLREQAIEPLTAREIDRRARAMWENIASETGSRRGLPSTIARTYLLARDVQRAIVDLGCTKPTAWAVVKFFAWVVEQSFGSRMERA